MSGGPDDRPVRDRLEPVGDRVGAGEHGEHPGQRHGGGGVDAANAGMGVRRAHHDRMRLAGKLDVVAEAALAGQQLRVFLARDRPADSGTACAFRHRFPAATIAASLP